ncbi:MAG TPA: outer membrane protein assembly factor BamA [Blastocatellia bacterium]|nr:outer membrane protein assembly factor BamA [Blastocatellia bacterium]
MTRGIFYLASAIAVALVLFISVSPALAQSPQASEAFVEDVEIRGNRRIPRESVLYYVQSKPQDRFDLSLAQRDLQSIIQMGLFDPLSTKLFVEDGPRGGKVVIFQVKEYPIIRDLQYHGMKSATESEVLDKFKERHLQVGKESQFDPAKANSARLVIRELLAEKGHPDAEVSVEVEEISATTVALIFDVNEGKRVRIKAIEFVGERDGFSQSRLRGAMKLVKEAGMFSNFSSKDIYFKDKLADDLERVRYFLGTKGYLQAKIGEPAVAEAGKVSAGLPLPLFRKSGPGLKVSIPIEVGRRYKISNVEEKGVTIFQPGIVTAISGMKKGDWVDSKKISENVYKGIKDYYGQFGYIQADIQFVPKFVDKTAEEGDVDITLEVDEGRQFTLRRLEFIGNSNTRDVVMRREVLLNEGDAYNKRYWDLSMLRLNQLGLFDEIKEKDAITRTNDRDQTVDIDLQVKEKGRQQIQLNGGVSGYQGSFFGLEYSTNNLLGYGESLSVAVSGGNRSKSISFGFTEPYLMGKPISLGFQVFGSQYQFVGNGFDYTSQEQQLISQYYGTSVFNADSLFTQKTVGGSVTLSGPLQLFTKKFEKISRFTRLQMSYSLSGTTIKDPSINSDLDPTNDIPVSYSQPRIITSRIFPSIYYNTKNASLDPTNGKSLFLGFSLSGGVLGGDVSTLQPTLEFQYFKPVLRRRSDKPHVLAMRFKADHIRAYGAPPPTVQGDTRSLSFVGGIPVFERFFLGGDNDIRGYNLRSLGPIVSSDTFASNRGAITPMVVDPNDSTKSIPYTGPLAEGVTSQFLFNAPEGRCAGALTVSDPNCKIGYVGSYPALLGGDTQVVYNIEYRVPIVSILTVAAFADVGTAFNARKYKDQITSSNFVNLDLSNGGVIIDSAGAQVTADNLPNAFDESGNLKEGFNRVFMFGQSQNFNIVRASASNKWRLSEDLRSSLGLEFRVQMPVINVPFRLIMAYNPYSNNPTNYYVQKKTVLRFSVGRTF